MKRRTTKRSVAKNRGGRPKVTWTKQQWSSFDAFCRAGARKRDICEAMRVDEKTITRLTTEKHGLSFPDYRQRKMGDGRASLVARQLEIALSGNVTMLIWLGKNWLGQSDRQEHRLGGLKGGAIPVMQATIDQDKLKTLTDEELNALERAVTKLSGSGADRGGESPAAS